MDEASETSEPPAEGAESGHTPDPQAPRGLRAISTRARYAIAGAGGVILGVVVFLALGRTPAAPGLRLGPSGEGTRAAVATRAPAADAVVAAGAVAAQADTTASGDGGATTAAQVDAERARAAGRLVTRLKEAYAILHDSAESAQLDGVVARAIESTFRANEKDDRRFAKEFFAGFGIGRFVKHQQLTSLGAAVVARASIVATHGIDPEPYDLAGLEAVTGKLARPAPSGEAASADPAIASVVAGALSAPSFDEAAVLERLVTLAQLPDEAGLAREVARVAAGQGSSVTTADVEPDVRVFRAFLQLAMDFRLLHKAGPFWLRDRGDVYEKEKKALKELVAAMLAANSGDAAMALLDPVHPQYVRMREVLAAYRGYAAGTCEKLPGAWRFRQGSKGKEVVKLQQRLACEGLYAGPLDGVFDGPTREAVVAYQRQHDLPEEGVVHEDTIKSLNVPLSQRANQVELALQRMREARVDRMTDVFIRVNLPAFMLRVYEHGKVIREQRVIVGTNRLDDDKVSLVQGHINRTKIFGTRLYQVIVNPTWILPRRVEQGELQTSVEEDPDYLAKKNIRKVRLGSGEDVLVQGSGGGNVLGKVKFLLEESNAVYLHDTDKRGLFKKRRRDFSHGCMRVEGAEEFAKWLLERDGAAATEVERAFGSKAHPFPFELKTPINLVTEYVTVDLTAAGEPVFLDDIYKYDDAYWNDKLPPTVTLPWGSALLRPRWVPLVDAKTVAGWKAEGKSAPRDLGPDGKPKKPAPPKPEDNEP